MARRRATRSKPNVNRDVRRSAVKIAMRLGVALLSVVFQGPIGASTPSALASGAAAPGAARSTTAPRPNLVFILTDDQDVDLGSLDYMPLTRSLLAAQGETFSRHFVPLSLCCPSRSTILTGQYAHNHQVYTNHAPDGGFPKFEQLGHEGETIGAALHAAGYRTALYGKYLNAYPKRSDPMHVPPGWDEWAVPVGGGPYDEFHYALNENGTRVNYGSAPQDYLTDVLRNKAVDFIQTAAQDGQPFFLYLATYAPHRPSIPAPRHADLFPGLRAPRTPSFNQADVSGMPPRIQSLPLLGPLDIAKIDALYRRRIQSLQAVDEAVAAIVATLDRAGQLGNTFIFLTSDNGYHMGQHRMQPGKYTPYDTDVRVPLIVRGPGVPAGMTEDAFSESVDFAPTLAELGGAALQAPSDGRSLVPLLRGGGTPGDWRQSVLLEQFQFSVDQSPPDNILEPPDPQDENGGAEYPAHLGLRTDRYKYVEYSSGFREVYDLQNDPDEMYNLAPQMPVRWMTELSQRVRALGACAADTCRALEAQPVPALPAVGSAAKM